MQWHRQMYYAIYVRGEDAHHRGGGDDLAARVLCIAHGLNIGMLFLLQGWVVDAGSVVTRAVLWAGIILVTALVLHVFTLKGAKLREEFESERAFVWGAGSLSPFAVYASLTCALLVGGLAWAHQVAEERRLPANVELQTDGASPRR